MATTVQDEFIETICEYKWTLSNFLRLNTLTQRSKIFSINDITWGITVYTDGIIGKEDYVSVVLYSKNCNTSVICTVTASNSIRVYSTCNFKYNGDRIHAINKFIQHSALDELKKENCNLIIYFKFIFSNDTHQKVNRHFNLINDIGYLLLKTRENADLTLVSNDESEHKVHKAILACRSKVFSAMFQHNMKECKDNLVRIEDMDNETLEAMLHFMYTGELIILNIGLDLSKKLLIAADKYELDDLKRICINNLYNKLTFDNILDIIIIADVYNVNQLKAKAKEYFLLNRKEILSTEQRKKLKDLPRDIIEDLFCNLAFI